MSEMRRVILLFFALAGLAVVVLTSCGGGSQQTNTPANSTQNDVIEGRFDVGDYKLYMRCVGSGSPTLVYFHGFIEYPDPSEKWGASSAREIPSMLRDEHRVCTYDRANVGRSDDVPGLRTGKSSVTDLHRLLDAAGVGPPYVLIGGSFGGLISYSYAATYPEEVTGMVLLDGTVPGLLELEHYWPKEERLWNVDWSYAEENIDQYDVNLYAQQHAGQVPDIPVTYLLAIPDSGEGWGGPPAWTEAVLDELPEYVDSFSPGVLKKVESPHNMTSTPVRERIAKEVEMLIASIPQQGAAHDGEASKK
jgi:pimeloyl-ACP methyl ester carboxylesterase